MLYGKNAVLGVTGCIAAYKACDLVSRLVKLGMGVDVIMTKSAAEFVGPLSFETLSGRRTVVDMFDRNFVYEAEHVSLAKKADVFIVAPATANSIAKFAHGIADDMLSTTFLASKAPKVVCPAMNTGMLDNENTVENIEKLISRGVHIIEPGCGRLACGDIGRGRMAEPADIAAFIEKLLMPDNDFAGKTVLVTAGPTEEPIDGVRYLTNRSSGKMGVAIAEAAAERGAKVIFVHGKLSVSVPKSAAASIAVSTTAEMKEAVLANVAEADCIIMAAAPADYRSESFSKAKLKDEKITLSFLKNDDIAKAVGKIKGDRKLVIFSAETENLRDNAVKKMISKNADMVVANDVTKEGAGFNLDTNIASLISRDRNEDLPIMKKTELADIILDWVLKL